MKSLLWLGLFSLVTAYHLHGKTAMGTTPRLGVVAGPRSALGHHVQIGKRTYRCEDVCPSGHWDVWMPSTKAARQWGRKYLSVKVRGRFVKAGVRK
jgi:hypothetical protein